MKKFFRLTLALGMTAAVALTALGQAQTSDPAITATRVIGKVTEINSSAGQITLKTEAGSLVAVKVSEKTTFERMPPGETDRTKAVKISLTDITVGDGVYARGYVAEDRKSVPAQQVVIVSQSDIAKKQEQERLEWRRRGVSGIVSLLNATTKEVTITSRSLMGATQAVIIPITDKVKMRQYPAGSIPKYSETKAAKFEDLKTGDQVRALGDKSADGTRLTAEEVVFGTFRIVGGKVTAIDAATSQIKIEDLQTKKPLTIVLKPDSVIRRFPENAAAMFGGGMGQGGAPGQGGAGGPARQGPAPQGAGAQGSGGQGPGPQGPGAQGPRPGGGANMADMLERLPTISVSELKVGDTIIMSSTQGQDPERITAISMVAGVEQLLTMIAMRQQQSGQPRPQNVDLNSNFGGMFGGIGTP